MFFIFIVILVISGIILTSYINTKNQKEKELEQAHYLSFLSIKKVLVESIDLIQKTKNIDTLVSRTEVSLDKIERMIRILDLGYEFDKEVYGLDKYVLNLSNENIYRICEEEKENLINKKDSYVNTKTTINAISNTSQKIAEYKQKLFTDAENYIKIKNKIDKLIKELKSYIFSGKLKMIKEKVSIE